MFIEDLSKRCRWRQYSVTLFQNEINDNMFASCLIIDIIVCKYQKEYLQIIDNKYCFVKIEVIAF